MAAVELLTAKVRLLDARDLELVESKLRTSYTWAYVDALAVHVAGSIVQRYPDAAVTLDRWADDADFWIRRSAILALLLPLRDGAGDLERFLRYADSMLDEKEFFIRKAIGWVLREVGKKRPAEVRAFLEPRLGRAAGLTVREAVKYLPAADRDALLAAYKEQRARA
jgi:3-methyladenine DNA glycosylase AlkD